MPGGYKNIKPEDGNGFDKHPENINRKGRPPVLPDLKEAIVKVMEGKAGSKHGLVLVLEALLRKAKKGDVRAIQELLDRGYGKSTQFFEGQFAGMNFNKIEVEFIPSQTPIAESEEDVLKRIEGKRNESLGE